MRRAFRDRIIRWISSGSAKWFLPAFGVLVLVGVVYVGYALSQDLAVAKTVPWILLGIALLIALGFEFVNGFHDTANAVATVIYTRSLPAEFAVMWSGVFNFLGVLTSSGAVAFGILSLLPVELILQVGSSSGFAMVFALLVAAILWNLGTWFLGLPASSSHTMVGSIIGVGLANQFMAPAGSATSGVDWSQATNVGITLLVSPIIGFFAAAILLYVMKLLVRNPALYEAPKGNTPPPWWIRALLIFTCTGVSFAHGSNDGQKGMGLIMLILIGVVPTAYALNRTPDINYLEAYKSASVDVEHGAGQICQARRHRRPTPRRRSRMPCAPGPGATRRRSRCRPTSTTRRLRCSPMPRSTTCRPIWSATPATTSI